MTIVIISMIRDSWGGSEELWYEMAKEALLINYNVIHISYKHNPIHPKMKELISKGLISYQRPSYVETSKSDFVKFINLSINFIRKKIDNSFEKVFRGNPDIVFYNGTCYSIANEKKLLKMLIAPKFKFFLLGHYNDEKANLFSDTELKKLRFAYLKCSKIFFVSQRSLKTSEKYLNLDLKNAYIVKNPVNMSDMTIIPFPSLSGIVQMALVGNLITVHKGQDMILNILKESKWKNRLWHLNIYGNGPEEVLLKKMCAEFSLEERVTFHGKVNDIRQLWQHNHLLLMPSRMEGMPLAVVEAMICGRPSVVTDVGGITDWITEDETGFIASNTDIKSISRAIEKAWVHRELWEQMGIAAHIRALELYDPHPGKTLLNLITDY